MTVKLATDRRLATEPGDEPETPKRRASETRLRLFSGNANRQLAEAICEYLGTELGDATVSQFADGETFVKINENIRGSDIFVFQPTFAPAKNLMELLVMIDAARRASAGRGTPGIPYFGFQKPGRKKQPPGPAPGERRRQPNYTRGARRGVTARGSQGHLGCVHARRAVGGRGRADPPVLGARADRDRQHPARRDTARAEDQDAFGRGSFGRGDPPHPRRRIA